VADRLGSEDATAGGGGGGACDGRFAEGDNLPAPVDDGVDGGRDNGEGLWVVFGGARTLNLGLGGLEVLLGLASIVGDSPAGGARTGAAKTLEDGGIVALCVVSSAGNAITGFGLAPSIGTSLASDNGSGLMDGGAISDVW
jgi:hypothetical protein